MRQISLIPILLAACLSASGERAMLECTADASSRAPASAHGRVIPIHRAVLNFRLSVASGWTLQKATLLLHAAEGAALERLEIAALTHPWSEEAPPELPSGKRYSHKVYQEANGWMRIEVDAALMKALSRADAGGIALYAGSGKPSAAMHTRESLLFAPYLIVDGSPSR